MSKWMWAIALVLGAHFGASYVAPTTRGLGVFNYVWPWASGDSGLLGQHPALIGIWLGGSSALLFVLAVLALFGIWVPAPWWRGLAMAGAAVSLVLMVGFFGPTKLLPIALDLAVLGALWTNWGPVRLTGQ